MRSRYLDIGRLHLLLNDQGASVQWGEGLFNRYVVTLWFQPKVRLSGRRR